MLYNWEEGPKEDEEEQQAVGSGVVLWLLREKGESVVGLQKEAVPSTVCCLKWLQARDDGEVGGGCLIDVVGHVYVWSLVR